MMFEMYSSVLGPEQTLNQSIYLAFEQRCNELSMKAEMYSSINFLMDLC